MMAQKNRYSHLTAKKRDKISFPMNWLKRNGLLNGKVLDFGCGLGSDVEFLKEEGFEIKGYDNYYFPTYPVGKFDTITCIYVLNVLNITEQSDVLLSVSSLLKHGGKAYFVVRRDIVYEGFRMHKIYKKPTFQTNVKLPFKSVFKNKSCEIYEYQHFDISNKSNSDCVFCAPKSKVILESASTYSIYDRFPVSKGHALIIPKRHVSSYFDLSLKEQIACQLNINKLKKIIDKEYNPDGYNIGVNIGSTGGQTISHVHIHLIPRYKGDVDNPIGGVRNVIPDLGNYVTKKAKWENKR